MFQEAVAIQLEEERLVKIRDVLKELPPQHYKYSHGLLTPTSVNDSDNRDVKFLLFFQFIRTLEFLMRHLVKMASYSSETNMHARNLAIVWAPNLLRFAIYTH